MTTWPFGTQPDSALLCPVPAIHLVDAVKVCQQQGRLAFGTGKAKPFLELCGEGAFGHLQLFIFPSFTGADTTVSHLLSKPRTARFAARLIRTVPAVGGRVEGGWHPCPDVRPVSTITGSTRDGLWRLFWEIEKLVDCEVPLSAFVKHGSKAKFAKNFVLKGPTRASTVVAA